MHGRRALIFGILLLTTAGVALAQEPDPSVNDSDFNTTPPEGDDAYLNETAAQYNVTESTDPTVSDSDFDTTVPTNDESYLDATPATSAGATPSSSGVPGSAMWATLAAVGAIALAMRKRAA